MGHLKLGTTWQAYQTAPLANLFSTQLSGFAAYQIALDQAEISNHMRLCACSQTDFFSERLSVLRGRVLSVGLFLLLPRLCSLPNCF